MTRCSVTKIPQAPRIRPDTVVLALLLLLAIQTIHPVHPADTVDLSSAGPPPMTNTAKSCPITIDGASVMGNTWIITITEAGITITMKRRRRSALAQLLLAEAEECPELKIRKNNQVF